MTSKEKYRYRKDNNICVKCGKNPPEQGKTKCCECAEKATKKQMDDYYRIKDLGICVKCRKEKAQNGYTMCIICRMEEREIKKKNMEGEEKDVIYKKHRDRYKRLKDAGLCVFCGKTRESQSVLCNKCKNKQIIHRRIMRHQNAGISRGERPNYAECYICGSPICKESEKLCDRCLDNARKNIRNAHENPTPGMLEQRERWKMDNRIAFVRKITCELQEELHGQKSYN